MAWTPKLYCVLLMLPLLPQSAAATSGGAGAQDTVPRMHAPNRSEPVGRPPEPQWPKTLPKASAAPAETHWPADQIKVARQRCDALLAGLDIVAMPAEPIRDGDCGAPAPIELISVGRNPQVTLSSPVIVTCEIAAALDKWLKVDLQSAAREHLGSPIVRLDVMSAYSCRNAYGRKKTRMSEHGRANALDIKSFLTERGQVVDLHADWGPTERDQKAQIAAAAAANAKAQEAKAEAIKREAEKADQQLKSQPGGVPGNAPQPPAQSGTVTLRGPVSDPPLDTSNGVRAWRPPAPALGLGQQSHLGGPKAAEGGKPQTQEVVPGKQPASLGPRSRFLRRVHASACRTFGTILGPEANEAHRNHFHVDMAERQNGSFCE